MFAPLTDKDQKNIIQDRFLNLRKDHSLGKPWPERPIHWHDAGPNPKAIEQHTRLRLWKLLREMDVPPVFLLHMEEELFSLLKAKTDKEKLSLKPKCVYHRIKETLENAVCNCGERH